MDVVKVPGPDHPITITGHSGRMLAIFNGHVIADSGDVLIVKEASYKPVAYFPRADVDMAYMARTELDTYCPYKGHAAYYTLAMDGNIAESAVWTYESPHPAMEQIRGRLAFYPNFVDVHEAHPSGADTGDAVRHTDSGSGASQSERWAPTATNPPV